MKDVLSQSDESVLSNKPPENDYENYCDEIVKPSRYYILKMLLEHGANPNHRSNDMKYTPLHWLAYYGDWKAIKLLLQMNNPVMVELMTPEVKYLNPSTWSSTCSEANTENTFEQIGAFNAFLSKDGQSPIDIAADKGHHKSVEVMLSHFLNNEQESMTQAFSKYYISDGFKFF
jgi:ankyrin repeat protein